MSYLKFWPLYLFVLVSLIVAFHPQAMAASMKKSPLSQTTSDGVSLEIHSYNEFANIAEVFSYTVVIANNGSTSIEPTLTNSIPAPLILKTKTVSATFGAVSYLTNTVSWAGTIPPGQHLEIHYSVIPPFNTPSDLEIVNAATLTFNQTTLKAEKKLMTQVPYHGLTWAFLRPITDAITVALIALTGVLVQLKIPYAYGFSIILFTIIVKIVTFPLNMQQIKSAKAMQELQPRMKALQEKYKDDREALGMAQMKLYQEAGVNPFGGCLPMLVQMPIWISLYWALIQLSLEDLLTEGFFWIPSLAGPVGFHEGGISWLWPFPPAIGWGPALAYLVLPVLLIVSQMVMQEMMTPPATDPQQAQMQSMMRFMPLMFGYFALIVPSGLTLYWFTNNLLMMLQQYFTHTDLKSPAVATPNGTALESSDLSWSTTTNSKEGTTNVSKRKSKYKR